MGKSFLTLDIAAHACTGRDWPDGTAGCEAGNVPLLSAEDDVADTIRPRLETAGADLERVHVVRGQREGPPPPPAHSAPGDSPGAKWGCAVREHGSSSRLIALNREMDLLFDAAARHGGYRLIVIDPISAYLDGLDANSNNDVRRLLSRLADLAERSGAAVLLVSHLRKTASHTPAVYRTLGSVAFTAVARALWTVLKDPSDPNRRLMLPIKMNMTAPSLGLGYRIVDPGRVAWDPQPLVADANDRGPDAFADLDRGERSVQARRWLRSVLMKGRLPSSEIKLRAREAGLCRDALWQAKRELGVKAIKPDVRSGWFWELPPPALAPMDEDLLDPFTASLSVPELIQTAQRLG